MDQPRNGCFQKQKDAVTDADDKGEYHQGGEPDDSKHQKIDRRENDRPIAADADSGNPKTPTNPARHQNHGADDDTAAFVVHLCRRGIGVT